MRTLAPVARIRATRYDHWMGDPAQSHGVRERKKRQTRAKLVEAAVSLVANQGYESTTVEQIASAVDVSPRTVAHYFPSKDLLLLAEVNTYADAVGAEFTQVPMELTPLQALLAANVALLENIERRGAPTTVRIAKMLRTVSVSRPLQILSTGVRPQRIVDELARRMGTDPADRRVELAIALSVAVVASAWAGAGRVYAAGEVDASALPALLRERLIDTFAEFVCISSVGTSS